jgi:hypothetical protein
MKVIPAARKIRLIGPKAQIRNLPNGNSALRPKPGVAVGDHLTSVRKLPRYDPFQHRGQPRSRMRK